MTKYKRKEFEKHFSDFLKKRGEDWVHENIEDLHHYAFLALIPNSNYYIMGRYQAIQWLGDEVFNVIDHIRQYELETFGKVECDFSSPERVVNMYAFIVSEEIVADWQAEIS